MKPAPGVWGIDLGQCALKALRLQEIDGNLTATAFDYVEYPKILTQPDADPDQLTREALEQFLSRNTLRGDSVAISVPGQSGFARFVKLPPVEEKKIADIVKFEAKQQIPFNLDEVVWDYQKLGASQVVDGFALETEIGLFAMKRDMVKRYIDIFKEVKVEVHVIQMAPLALCNYIGYDLLNKDAATPDSDEKQPCIVGLDIGTDSSNLVVTDGGKIIWQRPIPLGGNHFTRALTKDMKLTFAKAEHLKRNATKSGATELKKILSSLKPVLNDFVGEVQRSLGYFTNTHRDAQIEYMVGLGNAFRLPGLQRFLAEKLQLEVRKLDKMARLVGDEVLSAPIYQENMLSFGVAYGLCLQGIKRAKLVTNLLPQEIRVERLIRAKKPWAVAAAALLLVGLGSAALGNYLNERPYNANEVKDAINQAKAAVTRVNTAKKAFDDAKDGAQKEEVAVRSIVAGQAERLNWMHLMTFIGSCIPKPDGSNLPPDVRQVYFEQKPSRRGSGVMSGKDAYAELQRRVREGFKPAKEDGKDSDPLPPGIDDLVQFHIESVDCRFCDDLPTFWKTATTGRDPADVRPPEHYKKPPERKEGWVVEVAGFTYHHDRESFVRGTLLANLARMGIKAEVKPVENQPGTPPTTPPGTLPGTPAGAGTPAGQAGTPAPATVADCKEPVVNRVSHVLLYRGLNKAVSDASGFEIISTGTLDTILAASGSGGAAGGAPGGMAGGGAGAFGGGMPPAGYGMAGGSPGAGMLGGGGGTGDASAAPNRSTWRALSSRAGGGGSSGGGGMLGGPPGGERGGPTSPGGIPGMGPGSGPGTGTGTGTPTKNPGGHYRTEFIIVFVWDEPTPSDSLRATGDAAGAGGATTPPGTPVMPGGPR